MNSNPFGLASREPDLDSFLAGLEEVSAAYKDAPANAPDEVRDEFEVLSSEATRRYDTALEIEDPTNESVDAVIFGGPDGGGTEELLAFILAECGLDF